MPTETRPIIAETDHDGVMDDMDDSLIEQIWHDLDGHVTREQIRQVVIQIAAEFRTATITTFVPIFIRRRAREKLETWVNESRDSGLDGRAWTEENEKKLWCRANRSSYADSPTEVELTRVLTIRICKRERETMMSLKLRRNLPLVLLLLAILAFLALGLGDQPIIAYTAATDSQQVEAPVTLDSDVTNDVGGTTGLLETLEADPGTPEQ